MSTPGIAAGFLVWAAQSGLRGDANAAPIDLSHLNGGRSLPHVHLVQPLVFLLLVADVLPNRGLISPYRRYEMSACPKGLTGVVLFATSLTINHQCSAYW